MRSFTITLSIYLNYVLKGVFKICLMELSIIVYVLLSIRGLNTDIFTNLNPRESRRKYQGVLMVTSNG